MTVTVASFKAKYSKFSDVSDPAVEAFLAEATECNSANYFCEKLDLAIELYVANLLMQEEMAARNVNGPLSSASVDRESWGFASSGTGNQSNVYGQRYEKLCADCFSGGFIV